MILLISFSSNPVEIGGVRNPVTRNAQSNCNQYRASTCALAFVYDHHSHAQKGGRSQSPLSPQNADCIHADLLHRKYIDAHRDMAYRLASYHCGAARRFSSIVVVLSLCIDSLTQEVVFHEKSHKNKGIQRTPLSNQHIPYFTFLLIYALTLDFFCQVKAHIFTKKSSNNSLTLITRKKQPIFPSYFSKQENIAVSSHLL